MPESPRSDNVNISLQDLMKFEFSRDLISACLPAEEVFALRVVSTDMDLDGVCIFGCICICEGGEVDGFKRLARNTNFRFQRLLLDEMGTYGDHLDFIFSDPAFRDLKSIGFEHCHLNWLNFSALQKFTKLQELTLIGRLESRDISAIGNCKNLLTMEMDLHGCKSYDFSMLSHLPKLMKLHLHAGCLGDISSVSSCQELQWLTVKDERVSNLTPLSTLKNLTYLDVSHTAVKDLSPITNCCKIACLDCSFTDVNDISVVSNFSNITKLCLERSSVSDLSPLAKLFKLELLNAANSYVDNVSGLSRLTRLKYLDISNTPVTDVFPLVKCTSLVWIHMDDMHFNVAIPDLLRNKEGPHIELSIDGDRETVGEDRTFCQYGPRIYEQEYMYLPGYRNDIF